MKIILWLIVFLYMKDHAQSCKVNKIPLDWHFSNNVSTFRGERTVFNCTAPHPHPFDFKQCKISLRNKTCNAADTNGTFVKSKPCHKSFQDVIFKKNIQ